MDNDRHQVMAIPHMTLWVKWANNGSNGNNISALSLCFNHEYSKTELQKIIWKYRKLHQNQTRIDFRIIVWKTVIFNEIYRKKNDNEDYLLYISVGTDYNEDYLLYISVGTDYNEDYLLYISVGTDCHIV